MKELGIHNGVEPQHTIRNNRPASKRTPPPAAAGRIHLTGRGPRQETTKGYPDWLNHPNYGSCGTPHTSANRAVGIAEGVPKTIPSRLTASSPLVVSFNPVTPPDLSELARYLADRSAQIVYLKKCGSEGSPGAATTPLQPPPSISAAQSRERALTAHLFTTCHDGSEAAYSASLWIALLRRKLSGLSQP